LEGHDAQTFVDLERLKSPQDLNYQTNIIEKYNDTDSDNDFRCQFLFEGYHGSFITKEDSLNIIDDEWIITEISWCAEANKNKLVAVLPKMMMMMMIKSLIQISMIVTKKLEIAE